jgi:hypothetical protein
MSQTADDLREEMRERYAESARAVSTGSACGCGSCCTGGESDSTTFGEALYDAEQRRELPDAAALASLGCGNPTAVAELHEGETVDQRAERGSYVGCIAGAEYRAGLEAAGFDDISVEFTHEVAPGMHGAIAQAAKTRSPARRGLPVVQPPSSAGCC